MLTAIKLNDLDLNIKPRERMLQYGVKNLSDQELLSLILRSGSKNCSVLKLSSDLLKKYNSLSKLFQANFAELAMIKHIGPVKAAAINSIGEIIVRTNSQIDETKTKILSPKDIFSYIRKDTFNSSKEHVYVISLDVRNNVLSKDLVSIGTVNETLIHPREVFKNPIINSATSIALVHNHPSGDVSPSEADIDLTKRIALVSQQIGIKLLDHLIVSNSTYYSFKQQNLIDY